MPVAEQPRYVLHQSQQRALVPTIVSWLVLGIVFYLGVLVNVSLLNLTASQETGIKLISLLVILALLALGIFLAVKRALVPYFFYADRISFKDTAIHYQDIQNSVPKRDLLDKLFKTHRISVGNDFFLRHIPDSIPLESYLQQLTRYAQSRGP